MSVVTPDDVRALVPTALDDVNLQDVINREEAWLAIRVGQLIGERVETYYPLASSGITIIRRTDAVTVADDVGAVTDFTFLADARYVVRTSGAWTSPVTVTYTPTDELIIETAIIELVRLAVNRTAGVQSETIGSYSYTRADGADETTRATILADILGTSRLKVGTVRIRRPYEYVA